MIGSGITENEKIGISIGMLDVDQIGELACQPMFSRVNPVTEIAEGYSHNRRFCHGRPTGIVQRSGRLWYCPQATFSNGNEIA